MFGRIGIGQVLGAIWILGAFGLFFALALDVLAGRATFDLVPIIALELAIPVFIRFRLLRRPTARLARWSAAMAVLALFAAVMFAADASVSKSSSPLAAPILVGCLALLALSIVAAIRYRAPRIRQAE
jgi:hypothetical protein